MIFWKWGFAILTVALLGGLGWLVVEEYPQPHCTCTCDGDTAILEITPQRSHDSGTQSLGE